MKITDNDITVIDEILNREEDNYIQKEYEDTLYELKKITSLYDDSKKKNLVQLFANRSQFEQCISAGVEKKHSLLDMAAEKHRLETDYSSLKDEINNAENKLANKKNIAKRQRATVVIVALLLVAVYCLFFLLIGLRNWRSFLGFWNTFWREKSIRVLTVATVCAVLGFPIGLLGTDTKKVIGKIGYAILGTILGFVIGAVAAWIPLLGHILGFVCYPLLWLVTRTPIIVILCLGIATMGIFTRIKNKGIATLILLGVLAFSATYSLKPIVFFYPRIIARSIFNRITVAKAPVDNAPEPIPFQPTAVVTNETLNFRFHASANSNIIKVLKKGDILNITGEINNGWLPVEHNGDSGWVSSELVAISLQDGTYTFNPRLVGTKGNQTASGWLAKIVIHDGTMDLYLTSSASGKGQKSELSFGAPSTIMLRDLDDSSKTWKSTDAARWDANSGCWIIPFQNVASRHFTYIETDPDPDWVIKEIRLGEPNGVSAIKAATPKKG